MKNLSKTIALVFSFLAIILHSCKKEELPTISTSTITNIAATTATCGGSITSDGNASVTSRGICWSLNTNPTITDSKTNDGTGLGQFVSSLTGLSAGSTYHVRAYATNSVGTAYGYEITFLTLGKAPECITQPATNVTSSGVTINGTVNANDLPTAVTFEYGSTNGYGQTITATQSPVTGNSIINVNTNLTNLLPGATYHYRVVSVNALGTANGNDMTFTTASNIPTVITTSISDRTKNSAKSGGNITSNGGAVIIDRGVCWATITNPTTSNSKTSDGTGTGIYASYIIGLNPGALYHVRAYATNSTGTAYGDDLTFITLPDIPTIITAAVTNITHTSATSGGIVSSDGGASITDRGICWSQLPYPTLNDPHTSNGAGTGSFVSYLNCLSYATSYYVRAYAINSAGTAYGNQQSFPTQGTDPIIFNPNLIYGSVSDIEDNCYKTIVIGSQTWMAENLRTTKYNDGTSIPEVIDNWEEIGTNPGYCWYDNNPVHKIDYGALYKWGAVNTGKLCPTGWHVPTDPEWYQLIFSIDPNARNDFYYPAFEESLVAGGKLKEAGIEHWLDPNTGANNESGFTAIPGGLRMWEGSFLHIGEFCWFWSATEPWAGAALTRLLYYENSKVIRRYYNQSAGYSVRCVKD